MAHKLTAEQQDIIDTVKTPGVQLTKVEAVAGSSKSYTSNEVSKAVGSGKQLYLVFSKSLQIEAQKDLGSNVYVTTVHSLAYRPVMGKNIRLKDGKFDRRTLAFLKAVDLKDIREWELRYKVLEAMEVYFASDSLNLTNFFNDKVEKDVARYARLYIAKMFDGDIGMTHSGYLKYYHLLLSKGRISHPVPYELAIVDEAQDISAVALAIFKLTPSHRYLVVGDSAQAIFASFTHTINAFDELAKVGITKTLSKSFRVAKPIAKYVEVFCQRFINKDMKFEGMDYPAKPTINTHMYISRTNGTMITQMMELIERGIEFSSARDPGRVFELPLILISLKPGIKVYSAQYKFIEKDVASFYKDKGAQTTYVTPLKYILNVHNADMEISSAVNLVMSHGPSAIIEASKKATAYFKAGNKANTWLATAHSSKGLTVDEVTLLSDMNIGFGKMLKKYPDRDEWGLNQRTEALLYYVACTRCRHILNDAEFI